jgi:hypothetical protein
MLRRKNRKGPRGGSLHGRAAREADKAPSSASHCELETG